MSNLVKFWLLFAANLAFNILSKCQPDWSFDFVHTEVENNTPDKLFFDLVITRPARGVFALGGVIDIRQDIPNTLHLTLDVYYSLTGSEFIRTPYHIPEISLETFMNRYYKDMIMESMLNCTDNAPRVDGKFVAPLTKRTIHNHDCIISNQNFPSKLKEGYYKIVFHIKNFAEGKVEILCKVFPDS